MPAKASSLLGTASKQGKGGRGEPDFAMTSEAHPKLFVAYEAKGSNQFHETPDHSNPKAYAVDGAIHYAKHLSAHYDVVAVGVSGQDESELRYSYWKWLKEKKQPEPLLDEHGQPLSGFVEMETLSNLIRFDPYVRRREQTDILAAGRWIHDYIYKEGLCSQEQKPLLVAACLIALKDDTFMASFHSCPATDLPDLLMEAVERQLKREKLPEAKRKTMLQPFGFITTHVDFRKTGKDGNSPLQTILGKLDEDVVSHITIYGDFDILGHFYAEFLKYAPGDGKGLGIVLTPRHITELFCDLADLNTNSVIFDPCVGTGAFLIAAMVRMLALAGVDRELQAKIKSQQLVGVEKFPNMFALAASNMLLRGDGKSNLYLDSSLNPALIEKVKSSDKHLRPTVGMVNPPYSQKAEKTSELVFVRTMLDALTPGSIGIAIIPMSCGGNSNTADKEALLKHHRLKAAMSMPDELFYPVGTVTMILVFEAHNPHLEYVTEEEGKSPVPRAKQNTWFGYWKDDGFVKSKKHGRSDLNHTWDAIKEQWLDEYRNLQQTPGRCVLHRVTHEDEWAVEAYLQTDYAAITQEDFEKQLKSYALFLLSNDITPAPEEMDEENEEADDDRQ